MLPGTSTPRRWKVGVSNSSFSGLAGVFFVNGFIALFYDMNEETERKHTSDFCSTNEGVPSRSIEYRLPFVVVAVEEAIGVCGREGVGGGG